MERIPFADFVVRDYNENGAKIASVFMGGWVYVNQSREMSNDWAGHYCGKEKDDWRLYVNGGFFGLWRSAYLFRASDDKIKLNHEQTLAMRKIWDECEAARKARNKARKEEEKARLENSQWWP